MSPGDIAIALVVGVVAGAFAGLFGVGGGIVMVPAMVLLLGADQHVAQGTSLLVIVPTAIAGTMSNLRRAALDRGTAVLLAAAGVIGAAVGALVSLDLDEQLLRRLFGGFLLLMAVRVLVARERHQQGSS